MNKHRTFYSSSILDPDEVAKMRHDAGAEKALIELFREGDLEAYKKIRRNYQSDIQREVNRLKASQEVIARVQTAIDMAFPSLLLEYDSNAATLEKFLGKRMPLLIQAMMWIIQE